MANKEILCQQLTRFDKFRHNCVFSGTLACPVVIKFCDASAKGKSFSEATVDISANEGFPLFCCQLAGIGKLLSYLEGNLEKSAEIERLEKFFAHKQHTECLLSLDKSNEYNEYNIQVILAAHLFGPLAGSFEIGSKGFSKDAKRCPKCGIDISENLKNTSLGNRGVWHGYADILVKRCVVKIGTEDNKEIGSGEPPKKKMKTKSNEDDDSSSSDEDEVKKDAFTCNAMSQILSQTIVNAFAEVNKNSELSSSFIPSFIASSRAIRIIMYNCGLDSMIMSDNLGIFIHDEEVNTILNVTTILSVWYALNFESDIDKNNKLLLYKSNFKEQTGNKLEIYNKECTKPMTEAVRDNDVEFVISVEYTSDSVLPVIERYRSLFKHDS